MKLTIVAATGGIGRHLLSQASAAGHDVTAVARHPENLVLDRSLGIRVVRADLADPDPIALESAVAGADAVLSALGPRSISETGVVSVGTRALSVAMGSAGIRRLVAVTAAPIGTVATPGRPRPPRHDPGDGLLMRHLLAPVTKAVLRRPYADLALMEEELRASDLDWTVVRPPRLTDRPGTGVYRTALGQNLRRGLSVPRSDVAHLMLAVLERPDTVRQVVGIAI
jgi:uncharacterized protein YbjT (DUF2867 family)